MTSVPESVVAAKVVRNDGRTPFLRPQKGVAPVDGDDLVTRAWALATFGAGVSDGNKGDVTVSGGGSSWLLNANVVTDAKLRDSAALSVVGRSANSTGDPADIAAGTDGFVLRRSGTTLGFGTLAAGAFADGTIALGRLVNLSGPGYVGRASSGAGAPALVGVATPGRVTPTVDDVFHKFNATTGVIERCSLQELLDFIADYFGITPP